MKSIITFLLTSILLTSFQLADNVFNDKHEAQKAFTLLNDIRANPARYNKQFSFAWSLKSIAALKWNDTLALVAERKASDMASRNYFDHVDPDGYGMNHFINASGYALNKEWLKNKNANYFESIAAGATDGEDAIRNLILDARTPSLEHRKHLLGLEKWDASLTDIGIGYAKRDSGSAFKTYVCVIIAKHNW